MCACERLVRAGLAPQQQKGLRFFAQAACIYKFCDPSAMRVTERLVGKANTYACHAVRAPRLHNAALPTRTGACAGAHASTHKRLARGTETRCWRVPILQVPTRHRAGHPDRATAGHSHLSLKKLRPVPRRRWPTAPTQSGLWMDSPEPLSGHRASRETCAGVNGQHMAARAPSSGHPPFPGTATVVGSS